MQEPNAIINRHARMTGLYLHIPFCEKKCTYCDFYSIETTSMMHRFVKTLLHEIELRGLPARTITSVFFGGGTPSLMSPDMLESIISALRLRGTFADDCEWTMECNPGTVTLESLRGYRALGINRLSFGVQSFIAEELAFLHRIHNAEQADEAMHLARAAGFDNVNMDLMFALPPQTKESLQYSIDRLLALEPNHISAYSLIYEHGTPLFAQLQKGLVKPHAEDYDADMYSIVMERLAAGGFEQYEVSNFARHKKYCRHNLTYWHGEEYAAYGPSAHGYLDNTRYWNIRSLHAWTEAVDANKLPEANREVLTPEEQLVELAFLTLRADGLPIEEFAERFGIDIVEALQPDLRYWLEEDMITTRLRLTKKGYQVCDEITLKVLSALERKGYSVRKPEISAAQ